VDRDKALKQGVAIEDVYQTLQTFMGGFFVNYFNRFGRTWQVYVQAEGGFRTRADTVGQFRVFMEPISGPEFTIRFNQYRAAQINVTANPDYSSAQVMAALEEIFASTMPHEMGSTITACPSRRRSRRRASRQARSSLSRCSWCS
jgi:HAE1 family hydrophobic/amphiphilic exporter-1